MPAVDKNTGRAESESRMLYDRLSTRRRPIAEASVHYIGAGGRRTSCAALGPVQSRATFFTSVTRALLGREPSLFARPIHSLQDPIKS